MIGIKREADAVAAGEWPATTSAVWSTAPHTAERLSESLESGTTRTRVRSLHIRSVASVSDTVPGLLSRVDQLEKYRPPVRRVDGADGDRNLACACRPVGLR